MFKYIVAIACFLGIYAPAVQALSYVLDSEVNNAFLALLNPLDAATTATVNLHLGISPEINAFVTENRDMFIFSGLIEKATSAAELQGVLAHELAHVKANHIEQGRYAQDLAQKKAIITSILGVGALAAGGGNAGGAILMGGQAGAISGVLSHSRTAEAEADNIAAEMLANQGYSLSGMVGFFRKLYTYTTLRYDAVPGYLLTHPLPARRLQTLEEKERNQPTSANKAPKIDFPRLQAKVYALSHTPSQTLRKYGADSSAAGQYAQAVAYTLQGKADKAREILNALLKQSPNDPYYTELLGDIALDAGDIKTALNHYEAAQNILKDPLLNYKLAQAYAADNNLSAAVAAAQGMFPTYKHFAPAWQLYGVLQGKNGNKVASHVALAEAAHIKGEKDSVRLHLKLAEQALTAQTPAWLKAQLNSLKLSAEKK